MYQISEVISNDRDPSHVAEISFHPSGSYFAATYQTLNEVRIFDSRTRKLLQVLENPESQLDHPHGVLFTEKHLLISNTHGCRKPGTINVYRNASAIKKPIQVFQSPFDHLREPHSLAIRDNRLVVTYSENVAPSGAVVSYGFTEETGVITGLLDKTESWFSTRGDAKGICFSPDGTKLFVTFESNKSLSIFERILRSFEADKTLPMSARFMTVSKKAVGKIGSKASRVSRTFQALLRSKVSNELEEPNLQHVAPTKNGLAIFSINAEGKIARRPDKVIVNKHFCRLENVDISDSAGVVTDVANHSVLLYDLAQTPNFIAPTRVIKLGKATPHGAKFSPDGRLLVISSLGRKVVNQEVRWSGWQSPREDKIVVFERGLSSTMLR